MAITITREQRDAIYQEIMTALSGSGDVWMEIQAGSYDFARRIRRRHEDAMRVLDDIGWEPDPRDRELFELTMRPAELARALRELDENARATLHEQILRPLEEAPLAERALIAQSAYGSLLVQIAELGTTDDSARASDD